MRMRVCWRFRTVSALAAATIGACGQDGAKGEKGDPGMDGTACSVRQEDDASATISCGDGLSVTVRAGAQGAAGMKGTSCSVSQDKDGGTTISCDDGTQATIVPAKQSQNPTPRPTADAGVAVDVCANYEYRFVDNNDGTLTDCQSGNYGHLWQQHLSTSTYAWSDAKTYCEGLSLLGTGWKVPAISQLQGLLNTIIVLQGQSRISEEWFPNTPKDSFWSSSVYSSSAAYTVDFSTGKSSPLDVGTRHYVRCVR